MIDDEFEPDAAFSPNGGGHPSAELARRWVARARLEARPIASRSSHAPELVGSSATKRLMGSMFVVAEDDGGNRVLSLAKNQRVGFGIIRDDWAVVSQIARQGW